MVISNYQLYLYWKNVIQSHEKNREKQYFSVSYLLVSYTFKFSIWSGLLKAISTYYITLLSKHVDPIHKDGPLFILYHKCRWEEWWTARDFSNQLLHGPLIYLGTDFYKEKKSTSSPHLYIRITYKPEKQLHRGISCTETAFIKLWGNF